ncbi:flagellar assembly protein FliH [Fodinisporobacter ferrooxydans]|uniref:Flagellar assembly protein FliH n=1 Tax=Fodinisporobacter ferrooxydans TaxID=2901836 RepID=A0ABY4CIU5_9BACL|nr:flagellar assembly protein FliH [Alicyclobacillaceae bacterium MYW30-H2]
MSLSRIIKSTETSLARAKVIEIIQVSFDPGHERDSVDRSDPGKHEIVEETAMQQKLLERFEQEKLQAWIQLEQEKQRLQEEYEQLKHALLSEQKQAMETARKDGFASGYDEGKNKAFEEYRTTIEKSEQILRYTQQERLDYLAENEPFMIELVCEIARRVIHRQLQVSPDLLIPIIKQALQEIQDYQKVEIRVHPDDYEHVFQSKHTLVNSIPGQSEILIIPDSNVENGGCVIQSEFGTVDARIDTQLSEIKRALTSVARGTD